MENLLVIYYFMIAFLVSCTTTKKCDYTLVVETSKYGNKYIEIRDTGNLVLVCTNKINDIYRIDIDSIYNRSLDSKVFFACSWFDDYCHIECFYKKDISCNIVSKEIAPDVSYADIYSAYIDSIGYNFDKEKIFHVGKIKDQKLSIYTNVIVENNGELIRIPDATYEYVFDLKTMEIVENIKP